MQLPIPPRPDLDPPRHGKMGAYFESFATADLIQLIRQTDPPDDMDELEVIAEAHARGESSHNDFLIGLHERANREVFDAAVALCRDPDPDERYLGLRIIRELGDNRPLFAATWGLLEGMADTEEDPDVLWWVISCLLYSLKARALDTVLHFVGHPQTDIRAHIAFMIVGTGDDPNDPRIVETQLRLAGDEDAEVRYAAVYDFVEEITADTPAIRHVLQQRLNDSDEQVRELAAEALRVREEQEV